MSFRRPPPSRSSASSSRSAIRPGSRFAPQFNWTEYERLLISRNAVPGQQFYNLALAIDPACPMRAAAVQLVRNVLQEAGTILVMRPEENSGRDSRRHRGGPRHRPPAGLAGAQVQDSDRGLQCFAEHGRCRWPSECRRRCKTTSRPRRTISFAPGSRRARSFLTQGATTPQHHPAPSLPLRPSAPRSATSARRRPPRM